LALPGSSYIMGRISGRPAGDCRSPACSCRAAGDSAGGSLRAPAPWWRLRGRPAPAHFILRVRTEDGLEHAVLQPARVQLIVQYRVGEAAQVRVHIADALHAHLQRDLRLRLQSAPAAVHIARPWNDAVALRARVTGAHQDEGALGREVLLVAFRHQPRPLVAVDVVHCLGVPLACAGRSDGLPARPDRPTRRPRLAGAGLVDIPEPVLALWAKMSIRPVWPK
jgi:hypothetical protein